MATIQSAIVSSEVYDRLHRSRSHFLATIDLLLVAICPVCFSVLFRWGSNGLLALLLFLLSSANLFATTLVLI